MEVRVYQGTQAEYLKIKPKFEKYYDTVIRRKGAEYRYEIVIDSLMHVGIIKSIVGMKLEEHEKEIKKVKDKIKLKDDKEDKPETPKP